MNDEITAIGSVRPVMIVLRQLCRNRNTIATVSSAPSISVVLTPIERARDPVAVGVDEAQLDAGRQGLAQLLGGGLDRLAGLDDVGVLLLEDLERDRRDAVDARDRVGLALALDQRAEVGEADHHAVAAGDDDVGEGLRVLDLALDAHDRVFLAAAEQADRHVGVGALQRRRDVGRRDLAARAGAAGRGRCGPGAPSGRRRRRGRRRSRARGACERPGRRAARARASCARCRAARGRPSAARCRRRSARRTAAWRRAESSAGRWRPCRARPARRGSCRPRPGTRRPSRCALRGCSSGSSSRRRCR